jgi:hypothetical protein
MTTEEKQQVTIRIHYVFENPYGEGDDWIYQATLKLDKKKTEQLKEKLDLLMRKVIAEIRKMKE